MKKLQATGGSSSFENVPEKSMACGDSCNTSHWAFSNHLGTHIDFPRHFFNNGKTLDEYSPVDLVFNEPFVLQLTAISPATIIDESFFRIDEIPLNTDILLIKTSFNRYRGEKVYWQQNPGVAPSIAPALREWLPELRCVGFDFISLSSFAHRDTGRLAHRAFLKPPRPILLVEDMDLSKIDPDSIFSEVIIAPLRIKGADAAPCLVLAKIL